MFHKHVFRLRLKFFFMIIIINKIFFYDNNKLKNEINNEI